MSSKTTVFSRSTHSAFRSFSQRQYATHSRNGHSRPSPTSKDDRQQKQSRPKAIPAAPRLTPAKHANGQGVDFGTGDVNVQHDMDPPDAFEDVSTAVTAQKTTDDAKLLSSEEALIQVALDTAADHLRHCRATMEQAVIMAVRCITIGVEKGQFRDFVKMVLLASFSVPGYLKYLFTSSQRIVPADCHPDGRFAQLANSFPYPHLHRAVDGYKKVLSLLPSGHPSRVDALCGLMEATFFNAIFTDALDELDQVIEYGAEAQTILGYDDPRNIHPVAVLAQAHAAKHFLTPFGITSWFSFLDTKRTMVFARAWKAYHEYDLLYERQVEVSRRQARTFGITASVTLTKALQALNDTPYPHYGYPLRLLDAGASLVPAGGNIDDAITLLRETSMISRLYFSLTPSAIVAAMICCDYLMERQGPGDAAEAEQLCKEMIERIEKEPELYDDAVLNHRPTLYVRYALVARAVGEDYRAKIFTRRPPPSVINATYKSISRAEKALSYCDDTVLTHIPRRCCEIMQAGWEDIVDMHTKHPNLSFKESILVALNHGIHAGRMALQAPDDGNASRNLVMYRLCSALLQRWHFLKVPEDRAEAIELQKRMGKRMQGKN